MAFHDTQNPGIDIANFTQAEETFLVNLVGLSYQQGDVLYYDGTKLNRLGAGTSGQFLKTQGAGANPIWDNTLLFSGLTKITVGTTQPTSPSVGDLWVDTN